MTEHTIRNCGVLALVLALVPGAIVARGGQNQNASCKPAAMVRVPGALELSGLAVSRTTEGRLWAHNDSGQPVLFALNADGAVAARVSLTGAKLEDWEAVSVGPCPGGSCIYAADIGDNEARRKRIAIYRFREPTGSEQRAAVQDVFYATYPDGAHDAETLLVTPDGDIYIVTKGETGPIALYRFPPNPRVGTTHTLERVGKPLSSGKIQSYDRITDGTVSANGQWVVLRTSRRLTFYRAAGFLAGDWSAERTIDLKAIGEPQGEAVATGSKGIVYVGGEGGGKSQPGTFVRLTCTGVL